MSFDESQRYNDMAHNQSCADFRLHVESNRGNSYARMVPRVSKDRIPGPVHPHVTPVRDSHSQYPFRDKVLPPQSWTEATREIRSFKEAISSSNEMNVSVPNGHAGSITTEPCKNETKITNAFESFEIQPSIGKFNSRKSTYSSPDLHQNYPVPTSKFSEDTSVPKVHYAGPNLTEPLKRKPYIRNGFEKSQSQPTNGYLNPRKSTPSSLKVDQKHPEAKSKYLDDTPVPNAQYAGSNLAEPCIHEEEIVNGFETLQSQPANGYLAPKKSKFLEDAHAPSVNQKHPVSKSQFSEKLPVNGVHQKDLQCDDFNETYIVPIDEKDSTHLQKRLKSIYDKVFVVDDIIKAKEVVKKLTTQYRHLVHACDTEVHIIFLNICLFI